MTKLEELKYYRAGLKKMMKTKGKTRQNNRDKVLGEILDPIKDEDIRSAFVKVIEEELEMVEKEIKALEKDKQ